MDYAVDFTESKIYNGTVLHDSTLMEQGIYSELYKTIFTSRFNGTVAGMRHPAIHDSLCYSARQREVITLSGLLFKYNAIQPDANITGKMQVVNGQLKDVYTNGYWQNPYDEFKTVAISPSIITYNLTYCSVVLPSNLWLGNMNSEISTIQFDAGDGSGYRSLQFDVPLQLNYADTGWKHWIFLINLTNGQQLYSHSKVHFNNTSNRAGSQGGAQQRGVADERFTTIATEVFNGVYGVADVIISYHNANDKVIRKPLIYAEGLDMGHILKPEEPEGLNTFIDFVNSIDNSRSNNLRNLLLATGANGSISEYDIIYINWRNGTDWLQRNEYVLEEVIREVNRRKQPLNGVRQPNVVLGSSMGGVIARMALGRMDRNGGFAAHETRLYVSLDAPHQGANIPLGYQAAARHATRMYISTGPLFVLSEIFVPLFAGGLSPYAAATMADQPAARQLLIKRIDINFNQDNTIYQQFQQELRTQWAYPDDSHIRSIAISNGSECAIDQEFAAGSALIYHHRSTKTRFIGDLIFMGVGVGLGAVTGNPVPFLPLIIPGSSKFELTLDVKSLANGGGNQVYYGNIKVTKKVLWLVPVTINLADRSYTAPSGLLPLDTYPGNLYPISLGNQPGSASQDWMFSYDNSFFIQRRFAFIHTTSSLDIGGGNATITNTEYNTKYIGETPPVTPFSTPFQNFTTAFNNPPITIMAKDGSYQYTSNGSEPHEGLYIRSSNWLAKELNGDINVRTNCDAFCANGTITGNTTFCTSETFTAPFANAVTYVWSVDNPALVTLAPNGNSVSVSRNGTASGQIILTVNISGDCGTATLNTSAIVGSPEPGPINWIWNAPPGRVLLSVDPVPTATSYQWYLDGVLKATTTYPSYQLRMNGNVSCDNFYYFAATAINSCGTSEQSYTGAYMPPCDFAYRVSPNPSSSNISIEPSDVLSSKSNTSKSAEIDQIELYDKMGIIRKKQKFANGQRTANIAVGELPNDVYTLRIYNGQTWQSCKIIIRH